MYQFRPVVYVIGLLLTPLGLGMLVPVGVDVAFQNPDWQVFLGSSVLTLFVGISLVMATRGSGRDLTLRQAFLMITLAWAVLPAFAALPFVFSELGLSYTDAYFEAMSGLTTTGSTVISGLDAAPPGILIWRAILQWLGGLGIIVVAIAVLPVLKIGGMQLFRVESFDTTGNIIPRARQLAAAMMRLYLALTVVCAIVYMAGGMTPFEGFAHAMTTIATGGYSTSDASIGHFDSAVIEFSAVLFMILGSLPFVLYLQLVRGRPLALWRDSQVRTFMALIAGLVAFVVIWLLVAKGYDLSQALRQGTFNVVSIVTGTGYSSSDYSAWGTFAVTLFLVFFFIGGCAGSTSCGIKIFRYEVLFRSMVSQTRRIHRPHGVFQPTYNGRPLSQNVINSVISFLLLFFASFVVFSVALALTGLDPITAISGAGTALANVGPGLGETIGPAGTFGAIPTSAKWILSFAMLLGRLELFTVLVIFTPAFWRA